MVSELLSLFSDKSKFNADEYFAKYADDAQKYLNRDAFKGTPITGQMLADSARQAYDKHGKIVPVDLALSQAQFESDMGRKGRNPSSNPYNVGEFDEGTKKTFKSTKDGVSAYYNLMAKDYLSSKTPEQLFQNFTNKDGNRYASNKQYEQGLRDQSDYIRKFIGSAPAVQNNKVASMSSFDKAFAEARASGKKIFTFQGKKFNTETR